jgi:hypothetical protein
MDRRRLRTNADHVVEVVRDISVVAVAKRDGVVSLDMP